MHCEWCALNRIEVVRDNTQCNNSLVIKNKWKHTALSPAIGQPVCISTNDKANYEAAIQYS